MKIEVFRLSHRLPRDERITTHVFLVARAMGATSGVYSGMKDHGLEKSVSEISKNWGGEFSISYTETPLDSLKKLKAAGKTIVHLTMYGERLIDVKRKLSKEKDVVVVVGSEHVPGDVYQLADYNVSITNQPHSEVGALAITLHEMLEGKELEKEFEETHFKGAKVEVIPAKKGKNIKKK